MARARTSDDPSGHGSPAPAPAPSPDGDGYTVVARRYRPQRFEDVVGQDHVVQALRNAIRLGKVAQAYVFSGTRGVGKTSIARIFAKCLNCERGPTVEPCNACDICRKISSGEDMDVMEIDGASNNGVEAVRELRQNAGLRPSRARFKIYYIDEVHMLSTGAFNALLKTLEEPPPHVKFLFATTEPNKIPITVLSRCQKFDFAGIRPEQIVETLAGICAREGVEAMPEALGTVARRAGGSMRDAQSLLEQLLSSGAPKLTPDLVHAALGLAPDERVLDLIDALADRDPARTLKLLDEAVGGGVQPADLLAETLEYLRDAMILAAGADPTLANVPPGPLERLTAVVGRWPLDSILAALQILAEARGRLRGSPHGRLLVELALCRVARLEDFAELGELIGRLSGASAGGPSEKKKRAAAPERPVPTRPVALTPQAPAPAPAPEPSPVREPEPAPAPEPEPEPEPAPARVDGLEGLRASWEALAARIGGPLGSRLVNLRPAALPEPGVLALEVPPAYNWAADACDTADNRVRIEAAIRELTGRALTIRFDRQGRDPEAEPTPSRPAPVQPHEYEDDPLVQEVLKRFDARVVRVERDETPDT